MSYKKEFEDILYDLFRRRIHWLTEGLFSYKPGKPPVLSRKLLNDATNDLQDILSDAFASNLARYEFEQCVKERRSWHIKGHGVDKKADNFSVWFNKQFNDAKYFVYMFWGADGRCIYIGRTNAGVKRPLSHFNKHWINKAKRVEVYLAKSSRDVPKLECLAIHHFMPMHNKKKGSTKKWTSSCPLCDLHEYVEEELVDIFR